MNKYKTVEACLADLHSKRLSLVQALRNLIKAADSSLTEHIKWNAPSYILGAEDRITFNLHYPDSVKVILHMGATTKEDKKAPPIFKDTSGMLQWNSNIRATLSFKNIEEVNTNSSEITKLLQKWLTLAVEKQ